MVLIKTVLIVTAVLINSFSPAKACSEEKDTVYRLSDELTVETIMDDVYLVTHSFPWPANSMLVRCSDSVFVWVDTPYTDDAAEQVLDWMKTRFGDFRIVEINTGFHNDNLGGNGCLEGKGIECYGSDETVRLVRERAETTREKMLAWLVDPKFKKYYDAHKAAVYTEPDHIFELHDGLNLTLDGETIEVFYPGPSHSPDNVVVWFPRKKLLFGGCMVKSADAKNPGFTGDADLEQWPVSLGKVLERYGEAFIVVPGHGAAGGTELIRHTLTLF